MVLAVAVLAVGIPALQDYNVTWDEALGDFFYGERYLSYFTSFDADYLDFEASPYPADRTPDLSVSPFRDRPWEYYPLTSTLAAATSTVLSRWIGVLDVFDGFHAVSLLLIAGLLVPLLYDWTRRNFDTVAATAACLLLLTSPRLVAHALANIKDTPEMVFFAASLLLFARGWQDGSRTRIVAAGLIWGMALGTKANALFLPPVALLVVLSARTDEGLGRRLRAQWTTLALSLAGGLMIFIASWPYLWSHPIERLTLHLEYIGLRLFATRPESIASPIGSILLTTPVGFLALLAVGLAIGVPTAIRRREVRWILPLCWIGVVVGRLYLPNAVNFDGVRHFLEVFPAFAIVAGAGASWLVRTAGDRWQRNGRLVAIGLVAAAVTLGAAQTARTHPFQLAYWNTLAGGLDGARSSGQAQAGDYWGTSYRDGIAWLDRHAPQRSVLAVPLMQHTVELVGPSRLRGDIDLLDIARPEIPELRPATPALLDRLAAERPVYVMFTIRNDWTNELIDYCREALVPAAQWSLDGEPVLLIYRWPGPPSAQVR